MECEGTVDFWSNVSGSSLKLNPFNLLRARCLVEFLEYAVLILWYFSLNLVIHKYEYFHIKQHLTFYCQLKRRQRMRDVRAISFVHHHRLLSLSQTLGKVKKWSELPNIFIYVEHLILLRLPMLLWTTSGRDKGSRIHSSERECSLRRKHPLLLVRDSSKPTDSPASKDCKHSLLLKHPNSWGMHSN